MNAFDCTFQRLVAENISIARVIVGLNRALTGSNYKFVHKHVKRLGLDTAHWCGKRHGTSPQAKIPWEKILVENSPYHLTPDRRRALITDGLLENTCAICKMLPEWNDKPLALRIDHRNGIRRDHRLKNLRFVCPNCDSQLPTFCGRNKPRSRARLAMEESLKLRKVGSIPTESTNVGL